MSDTVWLLIILALIYLSECGQWLPQPPFGLHAIGLHALLPWRWSQARVVRPASSWSRGAYFSTPWPPLTPLLISEPLPFVVRPEGIARCGDPASEVSWDAAAEVRAEEQTLMRDGRPWARLATRRAAQAIAQAIAECARAQPAERETRLERFLDGRFDLEGCRRRLRAYRRSLLPFQVCANLLWLSIFAGLPAIIWTPAIRWWLYLMGLGLLAWIAASVTFRLALRSLPRELWPERGQRILTALFPTSAIRAGDLLAREVVGDLDPLTVGAALLTRPRFAEQARLALVNLTYPADAKSAAPVWLEEQLRRRIAKLLQARGLTEEQLLAPPRREDERVQSWCPRCHSQYLHGETCSSGSCYGLPLQPYGSLVANEQALLMANEQALRQSSSAERRG